MKLFSFEIGPSLSAYIVYAKNEEDAWKLLDEYVNESLRKLGYKGFDKSQFTITELQMQRGIIHTIME